MESALKLVKDEYYKQDPAFFGKVIANYWKDRKNAASPLAAASFVYTSINWFVTTVHEKRLREDKASLTRSYR